MTASLYEEHRSRVDPAWIDSNGHMNVAYYVLAFDHATDAFYNHLGIGWDYLREQHHSTFTLEMNVSYLRELMAGAALAFTTHLIDFDDKSLHYFHTMNHADEGWLAASNECLSLHVDMDTRRVVPFPPAMRRHIEAIWQQHAASPLPTNLNRDMSCRRSHRATVTGD